MSAPALHLDFPHIWRAEILPARPLVLPPRRFVYPAEAHEVERGALEVLVSPGAATGPGQNPLHAQPFLATCALGFADLAVPSGLWSTPKPVEICAVAGGYAYLIDSADPMQFTFLPMRPVLTLYAAVSVGLLLFIGHRNILAWGANGLAWDSGKLSDEGLAISHVDDTRLYGMGWNMFTDKETAFSLELDSGRAV